MRLLPCRNCGTALARRGDPPHKRMLGTMHDAIVRYLCAGCGRLQSITSAQFSSLPLASLDDLKAAGLSTLPEAPATPAVPPGVSDPNL